VTEARDGRPALFLSLAIVVAALVLAFSAMRIADSRATLAVTGSAKQQIVSDMIVWRGTFSVIAPTLPDAYDKLEGDQKSVRDYLVSKGIAADSLVFTSINTQVYYAFGPGGRETSTVTGYRLFQTVEVRSRDVDRVAVIAREATELIRRGVQFESQMPEYLYTKLSEAKVSVLALATQDARARAQEMAKNAGSHIGRLRGARMGVFQITPAFSTSVSDYGINDTSSKLKDITAVVTLNFEIR